MAIYGLTTKQMLVKLINDANPSLPFPLDDVNFDFVNITAIADPGNGHNTSVLVAPKQAAAYTGTVQVTYRRLDIANLFRGIVPSVDRWVANTGANATVLLSSDVLLPLFSDKYGINLAVGEWTPVNLTGYNGIRGDTWSLAAAANNLCYIGSVAAKWNIGEQTLSSLLPVTNVGGLLYPDGNDFTRLDRKYWVNPDGFDTDYTSVKTYLENTSLTYGYVGYKRASQLFNPEVAAEQAHTAFITNVLPLVTRRGGGTYGATAAGGLATGYKTTDFTLDGCPVAHYTLPHADVPEANSEFFNRVVVVKVPDDCPWGTGDLYFHYNV